MVVIDNLVKGAGGQAIQAMNLALGLEETRAQAGRDLSVLSACTPCEAIRTGALLPRCTPSSRSRPVARPTAPGWSTSEGQRVARRLRRPRVARTGHSPSRTWCGRSPSRRRSCSSTRRRCRMPKRERLAERLAALCRRAARPGLLLQLGRGGQRERARTWRGSAPGAQPSSSVDRWLARPHRGDARRAPTGRKYEAGARRAGRAALDARCRSTTSPRSTRAMDDTVAAVILEPVQGMSRRPRLRRPSSCRRRARPCDRARRGAHLRRGPVRRRPLGTFTAAEAVRRHARRAHDGEGTRRRPSDRRRRSHTPAIGRGITIGDLGSTFGGGPVPCAAALATLDVIEREGLIENAVAVGAPGCRAGRARARRSGTCRAAGSCSGSARRAPRPRCSGRSSATRILTGTAAIPQVLRLLPPLSFSPAGGGPAARPRLREVLA